MKPIKRDLIKPFGALALGVLTLAAMAQTHAANILWVSDNGTTNTFSGPGDYPDGGWIRLLQSAGHNVNRYNGPDSQNTRLTAAELAAINTNDLIILGRAMNSAAFQNPQVIDWNVNITKPVLTINAYLVRASRLGWCTGSTMIDDTPTRVTAVDLNDPATAYIFSDVAMEGNTTALPYDEAIYRNTSQILEGPVTGGRILATANFIDLGGTPRQNIPIIMEWPAGTRVRGGADVLGSYRMYFAGSSREPAGGNILQHCVENLTPTGEAMFLRAVEIALNSGVAPFDPTWPVGFKTQPQSVTVVENSLVTFSCVVTGAFPRTLQWQRKDPGGDWTDIPGATSATYVMPSVTPADDGAQFRLFAQNNINSLFSEVATLTVLRDTTAPVIVRVQAPATFTNLIVSFSEKVRITDPLNFILDGDPNVYVSDAVLDSTGTNAVLLVAPMTPGASYTLTVEGIEDLAAVPNPITPTNLTVYAPVLSCGYIRGDYYLGITGSQVGNLTTHPKYPGSVDVTVYYTNFNSRAGFADNYGLRMWGWFVPPTNGNYVIYVRSDDYSEVWMSPNDDPAQKFLIAMQNGANQEYTNQAAASPPEKRYGTNYNLVAGERYYLEALLKEGTGGDYITVVAKAEGEDPPVNAVPATVNPIPGDWFCCWADRNGVAIDITTQPQDVTVLETRPVTFTVAANISPADRAALVRYQWLKNGVEIPGARAATYSFRADYADNGAVYKCRITVPGLTVESDEATLTVLQDFDPPQILSVGSLNGRQIGIVFNEPLDPVSATEIANYSINDGAVGISKVELRLDGQSVIVHLGPSEQVAPGYTVKTYYIADVTPQHNAAPELTYTGGTVVRSSWLNQDIGTPGVDPVFAGSAFAGTNAPRVEVYAGGSDIWNVADGMHCVYEMVTGDFDAIVRVESLRYVDPSTKAGLIARDSLDASSRHVAMLVMPPPPGRNLFVLQWRPEPGSTCTSRHRENTPGVPTNSPAWPNGWVRLKRTGSVFSGLFSDNGQDWTLLGTYTNASMAATLVVGLAASAHNNTSTNIYTVAVFNDYRLQLTGPPKILNPVYAGTSFWADFESVAGLTYEVQYKNSLTDPDWTVLTTIQGDGTLKTFTDLGPLPPTRFYRLRVVGP